MSTRSRQALSTTDAAKLLGVAVSSVSKWIDEGRLTAGKTPGGHRRIEQEDLVAFLRQQKLRVTPELEGAIPKILIVDDDEGVIKFLTEELKERFPSLEILQASGGYAAGEIVGLSRPTVIILDLFMPEVDGFEVCRRIKSNPLLSKTAIIAMTGHYTQDVRSRILQAGASVCMEKPPNIALLTDEITKAMNAR